MSNRVKRQMILRDHFIWTITGASLVLGVLVIGSGFTHRTDDIRGDGFHDETEMSTVYMAQLTGHDVASLATGLLGN